MSDKELDTPVAAQAPDRPTRFSITALVKSGAIVPTLVIPVIAIAVLGMVGYIVTGAVKNGGLMPRPTALDTYACKGFSAPFQMIFRHGMDVVQLQTGTVTVYGDLLNGRIAWENLPNAIAQLGFVPPNEIVYDDARSLRVIDASMPVRTERECDRRS
jgi:hypothetical protein